LRGIVPIKEKDIQDVMDDYLGACFLAITPNKPSCPGSSRTSTPTVGQELREAVEFKFVTSGIEMKPNAVRIIEGHRQGIAGSKDWTKFYSVIYQTAPFASGAHFRAELNARRWSSVDSHTGWWPRTEALEKGTGAARQIDPDGLASTSITRSRKVLDRWKQTAGGPPHGKPVQNEDLWRGLLELTTFHKSALDWVRGTGIDVENNRPTAACSPGRLELAARLARR